TADAPESPAALVGEPDLHRQPQELLVLVEQADRAGRGLGGLEDGAELNFDQLFGRLWRTRARAVGALTRVTRRARGGAVGDESHPRTLQRLCRHRAQVPRGRARRLPSKIRHWSCAVT